MADQKFFGSVAQAATQDRLRPVVLAVAALLTQAGAQAQSAAAADDGSQVESVVITAQRRAERLQDVPVAVKAFSAKQIEAAGISSTQDFINLTPNMSFDNSFTYGNSFVVVRGVTQINNADSPVAVVVDGVPQNNQKQLKMNLFDVERIEVLKGPQGALYGRNAIGGAINIETKPPGNKSEGFVGLGLGNGGSQEVNGGFSGALVDDKVLFRVAGQSKNSDGLISNSYRNSTVDGIGHDNSLRAKLIINASDSLRLDLRASVNDYNAGATWDAILKGKDPKVIVAPRSNILGRTDGHTEDFSFKATADFALGTLTAITAYTDLKESYRGDLDFSNPVDLPKGIFDLGFQAGQGQNYGVKLLSQELRFTSLDNQPLRWIAGAYVLDTKRDVLTRAFVDLDSSFAQFDNSALVFVDHNEHNHNLASALFGQVDADLDKQWTLSGALRLDRDQRKQTNLADNSRREASFSKWQPKLTLTRKHDRDALSYATVSTGFRSGGFNAPGTGGSGLADVADFKPESLTNYELGHKTVLLGGRLVLNAATFYSRSKGFQYFEVNAANGAQIIRNIDDVALKGLDLDFRYVVVKGLEFDGGLGYTSSIIKANSADPSSVGKHTPKNSPLKINLGAQYATPVGGGVDASVRLDIEHRDLKYWHPDNVVVSPSLNLWGLRAALSGGQGRWTLALVGKNLGNRQYYADVNAANYAGLPYSLGSRATPRTVGLEGKYRF